MGRNIPKKLIMGVCALGATAVCLSSTTYAWFARNANAWTEEYSIRIHTEEGLEISADGVNFTDTITKSQLTRAIALERYNLLNPDNQKTYLELTQAEVNTYGETSLAPVSPDSNWNFYGFGSSNPDDYFDIDSKLYVPENLTAKKNTSGYLKFNLYFKAVASSNDPKDKYKLAFADEMHDGRTDREQDLTPRLSYIKGDDVVNTLRNQLNILPSLDNRLNPQTLGLYLANDEIVINPANAMRIGITGSKEDRIYEINQGYGSSAYEGAPAGLNDPLTNPMVTYFNSRHPKGKLELRDYATEYVETIKNFDDLYSLGDFVRDSNGNYNIVSATFYIWLDGYDADYLEGMDAKSIRFFLNFTKVEA